MDFVSERVRSSLVAAWGENGTAWAERVPDVLKELCYNWGGEIVGTIPSNTSVLVRVSQKGAEQFRVLKLSPLPQQAEPEAGALWSYHSVGAAPKPWQASKEYGALLMDEVTPGIPVADELLGAPLEEVADLLQRLHAAPIPPRVQLPGLSDLLFQRLESGMKFLPQLNAAPVTLVDLHRALQQVTQLAVRSSGQVLLHGDLSPTTILRGEEGAMQVIAPKPSLGLAGFDVARWAVNSSATPAAAKEAATRLGELLRMQAYDVRTWLSVLATDHALMLAAYDRESPESRAAWGELGRGR